MKLSITDLKAILKARVATFCRNKTLEDELDIRAGLKDIRTVLDDIDNYANELESTKNELREETQEEV